MHILYTPNTPLPHPPIALTCGKFYALSLHAVFLDIQRWIFLQWHAVPYACWCQIPARYHDAGMLRSCHRYWTGRTYCKQTKRITDNLSTYTDHWQHARGSRYTDHWQLARGSRYTDHWQLARGSRYTDHWQHARGFRYTDHGQLARGSRYTDHWQHARWSKYRHTEKHHPSLVYTGLNQSLYRKGPVWQHFSVFHSKLSCWKGRSRLDSAPGSPCRSLLSKFSHGGHGRDLLKDWVSELFSTSHRYVLHSHAIWVSGWGVTLPDHQAASSPRDPVSWLGPWWWHTHVCLVTF